jgi:hypothetical protein
MNNDIRESLQETGLTLTSRLPPNTGFILLAFEFALEPKKGRIEYISNANREDACKLMLEFVEKSVADGFKTRHVDDGPMPGLPPLEIK